MPKRRKIIIIAGFALALGFIGYGLFGGSQAGSELYDLSTVERRDLAQEVSLTGRVQSAQSVDLAFARSGRVAAIKVKVGDRVTAGQSLLELGSAETSAQLAQAAASVDSARASLLQYQAARAREQAIFDELKRGSRPEEIALAQTKVDNAQKAWADAQDNVEQTTNKAAVDLVNAYDGIRDVLQNAYTRADDAINKQVDTLFYNDATASPALTFVTVHSPTKLNVEYQRVRAGQALEKIKAWLPNLQSFKLASLEETLKLSKSELIIIRDFLVVANETILDAAGLTQAAIDTYRVNITAGLNNVNAVLLSVSSQEQKIAAQKVTSQNSLTAAEARLNDAQAALTSAQAELNLKRAPASAEELSAQAAQIKQAEANIASQQARVREAQAGVAIIRAQLQDAVIQAPFNGVVARQETKPGEIVVPNTPVVSLISDAKFEIEANLAEVDIAKTNVGNSAQVTLDAYGSDANFAAAVVAIDPAETIVEGVPTYKVKLQFNVEDERIRSGMTANVVIAADKREAVLVIPQRAVFEQAGQKKVRLLRGEGKKATVAETAVVLGLRGSDGGVEVLEGLNEGDRVVTGEKEK